jgi:hypothetical protein
MNKQTNRFKLTVVVIFVALALVALGVRNTTWVLANSDSIPNNLPQNNPGGMHATFSTQSSVQLTGEYFRLRDERPKLRIMPHRRRCVGITPGTLRALFDATAGDHPVFNELDANNRM